MPHDPVTRIRRFNRAVTRETGVLDQSFLGRGRPLGAARVLHAIGRDGADLESVRTYLGLDKTLLSRFLKSLQEEDLVLLTPDPEDARRRTATLTAKGQEELTAYNALSDARAQTLLARGPNSEALLAAMDLIASALGQEDIEIIPADPRDADSRYCLQAYYAELSRRFEQGFDVNLSADPEATDMIPPRGNFLLSMSDGLPVGCVGIKGTDKGYGEIKRLWIADAARGLGLAKRLMTAAEYMARSLGMTTLRLDTNAALPEAIRLYETTGWHQIDRFNDDPYPTHFFEKHL